MHSLPPAWQVLGGSSALGLRVCECVFKSVCFTQAVCKLTTTVRNGRVCTKQDKAPMCVQACAWSYVCAGVCLVGPNGRLPHTPKTESPPLSIKPTYLCVPGLSQLLQGLLQGAKVVKALLEARGCRCSHVLSKKVVWVGSWLLVCWKDACGQRWLMSK